MLKELDYYGRTVLAARRHALVRGTSVGVPSRPVPVRWESTGVRRCAAQWCPREALAFHVCCRECAPVEVSCG